MTSPRPAPFSVTTTEALWTDPHISGEMLTCHLDPVGDLASRRASFIDRSVAWIVDRFGLGAGRHVLDLGCGPGLYTTRLAATGARVVGADFSPRSIEHARELARASAVEVEHVVASYLTLEMNRRFDLVTLIMCDYGAMGPGDRHRLLTSVRDLLPDDGAFLFDVSTRRVFDEAREQSVAERNLFDGFWAAGPYVGHHDTFKYAEEALVLDRFRIVEPHRTRTFYNWLQTFEREGVEAELSAAGLEVEAVFADVAGTPWRMDARELAVVARPRHA